MQNEIQGTLGAPRGPVNPKATTKRALVGLLAVGAFLMVWVGACAPASDDAEPSADVETFLADAEDRMKGLAIEAGRAAWVQSNFITEDTQALAAITGERATAAGVELAQAAAGYDGQELSEDAARRLRLLKQALVLPAPADAEATARLSELSSSLTAAYGTGRFCRDDGECLTLDQMGQIMATSRDADELLDLWRGWRTVSPAMRGEFEELVALANEGAQELGYPDVGALWRSKYDMEPDAFAAELDRLWEQVRPLYEALHCHVRARLGETYGTDRVPADGMLPAHLLGNMWAQTWSNIYDLVQPATSDAGFDLTERLVAEGLDAEEMVRYGERFFTSLGFEPLPETFWTRSLFTRPRDRDVVCHASAWNLDYADDLRIKMCINVTAEDFNTIHHELGHNFYQRAYNHLPLLYQDSANDGFHEAVGDTVALSVTPSYLVQVGLLDAEPDPSSDLGILLRQAMDKVAFLPFGLLIDQWRWKVFSGEVGADAYNQGWWDLRAKYQGVAPPEGRGEDLFDPGAKYHVPGNVPYTRYFLAHILQFQLHRGLCEAAGYEGVLHRCSIYGNAEAGRRLQEMLAMGQSRPWPEALELVTGQREMDATAILDYFAPLKAWLDEQNEGRQCGW